MAFLVLPVESLSWRGRPAKRENTDALQPYSQATEDSVTHATDDYLSAEQWMRGASASKNAFECLGSTVRGWSGRCDQLSESDTKRMELAAVLTVCEIRSVQSFSVPRECLDWSEQANLIGGCIE